MKNSRLYLLLVIVLFTSLALGLTSCKDDDVPSLSSIRTADLAKTWVLADGVSVTFKGTDDVTAEYTNFSLTFGNDKSYTSQNGSPIWPGVGDYIFGGTQTTPNINQLIRNDGTVVNITSTDEQIKAGQLTLSFDYVTPTARMSGPDGNYVMKLKAQ